MEKKFVFSTLLLFERPGFSTSPALITLPSGRITAAPINRPPIIIGRYSVSGDQLVVSKKADEKV